ncbi:hypothetical protein A3E89_02050 [Candidatus Campbellbacteria bacterium RIFCSPHIGHO2_12_FULL_35_10]|uniref:Uncharacterized protein n=1 Tax=Candidatus Campbellbacteria bacterium RIFCSPHIGHO2_12_FULL_35_10 TaxID=1797578 RepID=A0A1F5EQ85_9BACT|nr:MAG: hypothetical protein A3E89_02050 [Candidatus Campbellbacteria bacterium RIFCSPHIGHO2_12_FULL_35_10]
MENNTKINQILSLIVNKLETVNYALIGSANLYIQGLEINPRDIDILTTPEDIKKIDEILGEYRTKEIFFDESGGRNSFRSYYVIDGVEIEVLGNVNNDYRDVKSLDNKIYVEFDKIKIPCISLAEELNTYERMGRTEKYEMVKNFLNK